MRIKDKITLEEKKKKFYDFFIDKGFSPIQASALLGNALVESNLNTRIEGDKNLDHPSVGIFQHRGDRLQRLKSMYDDPYDFSNQLEFAYWELQNTHRHALKALQEAQTPEEAAIAVRAKYEVAWDKHDDRRIQNTKDVLAQFYTDPTDQRTPLQKAMDTIQMPERKIDNTRVTQKITNFPKQADFPTFTGQQKEEPKPDPAQQAKQTLEGKKNEMEFLKDLLASKIPVPKQPEPQQYQQPVQPYGSFILDKAKEVGLFQEGGEKQGFLDTVYQWWFNPKNYGVKDYSIGRPDDVAKFEGNQLLEASKNPISFDQAFELAKKDGEPEFIYKNKRYSTKVSDMSKSQEFNTYGIISEQASHNNFIRDRWAKNVKPDTSAINSIGSGATVPINAAITGLVSLFIGEESKNKEQEHYSLSEEEYDKLLDEQVSQNIEYFDKNPMYRNYGSTDEKINAYKKRQKRLRNDGRIIDDIFQQYLGKPIKYGTMEISKFAPTMGNNNNTYYSINPISNDEEILNTVINSMESGEVKSLEDIKNYGEVIAKGKKNFVTLLPGLGKATVGLGEDKKGKYLSYYDEWDVNITGGSGSGKKDSTGGIGRPLNIYDRIYYKKDKQGNYKIINP